MYDKMPQEIVKLVYEHFAATERLLQLCAATTKKISVPAAFAFSTDYLNNLRNDA